MLDLMFNFYSQESYHGEFLLCKELFPLTIYRWLDRLNFEQAGIIYMFNLKS
jgi:hypothetical protein